MFYRYRGIKKNNEGVSAVEFALIAPVFFLMLIGFLELGLILATYLIFEGATGIGSRIGKTGYTEGGFSRENYIRQEIVRLSGGFLDSNLLTITPLSYDNFQDIGRPEPCTHPADPPPCVLGYVDVNHNGQWDSDQGTAGVGDRSDVVLYRVTYPWTVFTPLMGRIFGGSNGQVNITAIATVKNEKF